MDLFWESVISLIVGYGSICLLLWSLFHFESIGDFTKWLLIDFTGLSYIYGKFWPKSINQNNPPPTFFLWILGIYVALYGLASQRHENKVDIIEARVNYIYNQFNSNEYKVALSNIPIIQNMKAPYKPELFKPISIFKSLSSKEYLHNDTIKQLKQFIIDRKDKLNNVDLSYVKLDKL